MTPVSAVPSPSRAVPTPSANPSDLPQRFVCPVTGDVFHDPVVAADGRTYERAFIVDWFEKHGCKSPVTHEMLAHGHVAPNRLLRDEMQACGHALDRAVPAPLRDVRDVRPAGGPHVAATPVHGAAAPQGFPRPAMHSLPPLASLPDLRPLPPMGEEMVTLQVPMHTQTAWVWTALGADEEAATVALDALVQAGEAGRERAVHHIATCAVCPSVRAAATHALGQVPSVIAVDLLLSLADTDDPGVAEAANSEISSSMAEALCHEASDSPTDVNRCLRDLICRAQDSDTKASDILSILMLRASDYASDVAQHLTAIADTCHARIALEAWEQYEALCRKDGRFHEHWVRNLGVLQGAMNPDVSNAAKRHMA